MSEVILYGIKNCDTVKKARNWLNDRAIDHQFHDFRVDGITKPLVNNFLKQVDLETLINKRGTSWRKISDEEKTFKTKTQAIELILNNPTIIKRPVLVNNKKYYVGFNDELYTSIKF